jgi:hypothetical protein
MKLSAIIFFYWLANKNICTFVWIGYRTTHRLHDYTASVLTTTPIHIYIRLQNTNLNKQQKQFSAQMAKIQNELPARDLNVRLNESRRPHNQVSADRLSSFILTINRFERTVIKRMASDLRKVKINHKHRTQYFFKY